MVTMVWVVSRFRCKGPSWYLIFTHTTTTSGQRSCASWASQPQKSAILSPQPGGKTTKFIRTGGGNGGKKKYLQRIVFWYVTVVSGCQGSERPSFFIIRVKQSPYPKRQHSMFRRTSVRISALGRYRPFMQ